ncbi:hypothetical protein J7426_14260 [Tropicibacter sp. R16_0]|uniref:hypothetical protein n=1 Tax=Tropicibacter sp. R16_0 TaxID=2821102 RepID=UPI001ADCE4F2|nr:hypothetical protein [Tropicibacter sp. R16_0]MBO9451433.1 hypothetical protein [Tropicibacter sp. R16_0]
MNIFNMDDTNFDTTRRSIIAYGILSFLTFWYRPTFNLNEIGEWTGLEFADGSTIGPLKLSVAFLVALIYLFLRNAMLFPIYNSLKTNQFEEMKREVEKHYDDISSTVEKTKLSLKDATRKQQKIKLDEISAMITPLTTAHGGIIKVKQEAVNLLEKHSEILTNIKSDIGRIRSEILDDAGYRSQGTINPTHIAAKLDSEFPYEEYIKQISNEHASVKLGINGIDMAISKISKTQQDFPPTPRFDKNAAAIAEFSESWNVVLEDLKNVPSNFYSKDREAAATSDSEVMVFGRYMPLIALGLGLSFAVLTIASELISSVSLATAPWLIAASFRLVATLPHPFLWLLFLLCFLAMTWLTYDLLSDLQKLIIERAQQNKDRRDREGKS